MNQIKGKINWVKQGIVHSILSKDRISLYDDLYDTIHIKTKRIEDKIIVSLWNEV